MPKKTARKKPSLEIDISKHVLVPKHSKLSEKEKKELMKKFSLDFNQMPKILISDPAIKDLGCQHGDIIKIERKSPTAGKTYFYRVVYDERKEF